MKQQDLPYLPSTPGVYQFKKKAGKILYIGKAKDLSKRVGQYFSPGSVWKVDMVHQAYQVEYIETTTEEEALLLEEQLIKQYYPEYNRLLKHNSNYVWIKYTDEDFPKVQIVRKRKSDKATYIWPKHRSRSLYNMMKYLRRVFRYRTMPATQFRTGTLDMDFHLWLDEWWSVISKLGRDKNSKNTKREEVATKNKIDMTLSYDLRREEYGNRLDAMKHFLEWDTQSMLDMIAQQITEHTALENYERCIQLRDIYTYISQRDQKYQTVVLSKQRNGVIWWISSLENYHIVVLVKFVDGKIIDVIREKSKKADKDLDQLILELETEFGMSLQSSTKSIESPHLLTSKGYIRLTKQDKTALGELHQRFLDSYITSQVFDKESVMNDLLAGLQTRYTLTNIPYHMECVDISHLSGGWISGWLSCMINGLPSKRWYRQYKIKSVKGWHSDDYQSLKEVIIRRFELEKKSKIPETDLPDLFILDGGKWQLGILRELSETYPDLLDIMSHTQFVSLGKGDARSKKWRSSGALEQVFSFDNKNDIVSQDLTYDQIDRLLIQIRDEAHRFANRYRKKQMEKELK